MADKLKVNDLRISFRTVSGKLQAVRGITFDLKEGETLAIVGESGSGKSVTSKAILGILAGNSIVEGGEILYDSKDLLKIPEDEFHKIRGDKISMIFQDPLSSLNPIVRIGKQLTEAMILKGKARQKSSRNDFNSTLKLLRETMVEAIANGDEERAKALSVMCENFDKFEFKHIALEKDYKTAHESANEAISDIDNILFLISKDALTDAKTNIKNAVELSRGACHTYVVSGEDEKTLTKESALIEQELSSAVKSKNFATIDRSLRLIREILDKAIAYEMPNFFCMGYYLTYSNEPLPEMPVGELNKFLREYLDKSFMLEFIDYTKIALEYSAKKSFEKKEACRDLLKESLGVIREGIRVDELSEIGEKLIKSVNDSIDKLEIVKDSAAYTFAMSIRSMIATYARGLKKNNAEEARYKKECAKFERLRAKRGKEPDWSPAPAAVIDLELALANIRQLITRLLDSYVKRLDERDLRNYSDEAVAVIDYLKMSASGVINRVTRSMAKHRALKLMEEVGIPEPRRRYKQYPFEFSGGMRQRIVIAIALAANPDILICDEPTTALDVTIQAQILELINKLKVERNLSIIFITHDLGVVANMADKVAVMYAGKIVEYGTAEDIFYDPRHPYTWALLSSMPDLDTNEKLDAIPGTPPNLIYPPVGDAFAARNKYAMQIDFEAQPPMFKVSETHSAATWLLHPDAPKVEIPKIITDRISRMKIKRGDASNE